jgi:membrane-associated protein
MQFPQVFNVFDANSVIATLGLIGVLAMIFMEIGLLVGLVLPGGDTMLFLAGIAASSAGSIVLGDAQISALLLFLLAPIFAILGGEFAYWTGSKYGRKFFDRSNGRYFNHKNVVTTEKWIAKYGIGKALVLSRFVPVVRTLISPVCGVIGVSKKQFRFWNAVSGVAWTQLLIGMGFLLGGVFDVAIDKYLLVIILVIIAISLMPIALEIFRGWRSKKQEN